MKKNSFSAHFIATTEEAKKIKDGLEKFLLSTDLHHHDKMDVALVFDEHTTNTIMHGTGNKKITIEFTISIANHILTMVIIDNGDYFDLNTIPTPDVSQNISEGKRGGFGIHLIKSLMNEIAYEHKNNKNILTMKKYLRSSESDS